MNRLLRHAIEQRASDVHLIADRPPMFRIDGNLVPGDRQILTAETLERVLMGMMNEEQRRLFLSNQDLDFAYIIPEGTRFRVNVHMGMRRTQAAMRVIADTVPSWESLGLPSVVRDLAKLRSGMIIVTGPAGSGKSTSLASIVDLIASQRQCMIISIEDPIEYVHNSAHSRAVVKQREVGVDTPSFASALRHVLRQDPNVILIGEIRDLDSISMALTAAETGHLVLTSLHTSNTVECVNRILDAYPPPQQAQVRNQLASCLQAVIGQLLLPRRDQKGVVLATEVLLATPAVRNLIRQGQMEQIAVCIETGAHSGMHLMDDSLLHLMRAGLLEPDIARGLARNSGKFASDTARPSKSI